MSNYLNQKQLINVKIHLNEKKGFSTKKNSINVFNTYNNDNNKNIYKVQNHIDQRNYR